MTSIGKQEQFFLIYAKVTDISKYPLNIRNIHYLL